MKGVKEKREGKDGEGRGRRVVESLTEGREEKDGERRKGRTEAWEVQQPGLP